MVGKMIENPVDGNFTLIIEVVVQMTLSYVLSLAKWQL